MFPESLWRVIEDTVLTMPQPSGLGPSSSHARRHNGHTAILILAILVSIFTCGTASGGPRPVSCERDVIFSPGDEMTLTNIVRGKYFQSCKWIIRNTASLSLTCQLSRDYHQPGIVPATRYMRFLSVGCMGGIFFQPVDRDLKNNGLRLQSCDAGESSYGPTENGLKITFEHTGDVSSVIGEVICTARAVVRTLHGSSKHKVRVVV